MPNKQALSDFLATNGCQDPEEALAPLEKLFQIAEAGEYLLAPLVDIRKLTEAVASVTSGPISKVVMISLSNPFPKPEWMGQRDYKLSLLASLAISHSAGSLRGDLTRSYPDVFGSDLGNRLKVSFWTNLGENLWTNLLESLLGENSNFGINHWDCLPVSLNEGLAAVPWSIRAGLNASLRSYLLRCLLNDQEEIAKLRPLVELWSQCLILGFQADEPETLLVILK